MKTIRINIIMSMLVCTTISALAQRPLENTMSSYYANKMLWNPAMTAAEGNKIYALQNRSWLGFDGAPVLTSISGEMAFGKNSSLGLIYMNDKAGVLIRSYGLVNYGYRVKFSDKEQLRLGASLAFNSDRIDNSSAGNDPILINKAKNNYDFDGNFGLMYQKKTLKLGLTVNRIRENFDGADQQSDLAIVRTGAYYGFKINKDEKLYLEPMAMLRFYRSTSAIADIGLLFRYSNLINITGVYQTTGNIRMGAGLSLKQLGEANFFYNTNHKISNNNSQQYEIGIGIYIKGKKED